MNMDKHHTVFFFLTLIVITSLGLAACGPGEPARPLDEVAQPTAQADAVQSLVFWSTENQPERAEKTRSMLERFTQETGVPVELVLVEDNSIDNLIESSHLAGLLPDVVFLPMDFASAWHSQGILDAEAAATVPLSIP